MAFRTSAWTWLALFAATSLGVLVLYPDSYQHDAGHHYLFARYAWLHPDLFVGVWSRPLFMVLYAGPALLGYPAAKLLTVFICLLTAHQTYRLAVSLNLARAALAIPLIFLQPSFFLMCADTMTEPLFALVFIVALRLHLSGRVKTGMLVASLMVAARPEGAFLCALWGLWVLIDRRDARSWLRRIPSTLLLATGGFLWWLGALALTGDPLFIRHNWPSNWSFAGQEYGTGHFWSYIVRIPEFAGPLLAVPLLVGLFRSIKRREFGTMTSSFLLIFGLHTILWMWGLLGSAGYARYLICVSPAMALLTLVGWNALAERASHHTPARRAAIGRVVLVASAVVCVFYTDMANIYGRDVRAVRDAFDWFQEHPRPVSKVIWSQVYMCVLFDRDPWERPGFLPDKAADRERLRSMPPGTLVFWDGETGPRWYGYTGDDFEALGYTRLRSQTYLIDGWLQEARVLPWPRIRRQEMHLMYKEH